MYVGQGLRDAAIDPQFAYPACTHYYYHQSKEIHSTVAQQGVPKKAIFGLLDLSLIIGACLKPPCNHDIVSKNAGRYP